MSKTLAFFVAGLTLTVDSAVADNGMASNKLRDPTRPLHRVEQKTQSVEFRLQAIFTGNSRHTAIVNGKTVSEGDDLEGAKILRITEKSVVYRYAGVTKTITLRPSVIKTIR